MYIFSIDSGEDLCQSTNKDWEHWYCFRTEDKGNGKCPLNGVGILILKKQSRQLHIMNGSVYYTVIYSQDGIEIGWAVIWKHSKLQSICWRSQSDNFIVNLGYGGRFSDMRKIWFMNGLLVSWMSRIYQAKFLSLFGD